MDLTHHNSLLKQSNENYIKKIREGILLIEKGRSMNLWLKRGLNSLKKHWLNGTLSLIRMIGRIYDSAMNPTLAGALLERLRSFEKSVFDTALIISN